MILDAAPFLDSDECRSLSGVAAADVGEIAQRLLGACYDDLGKAPRLLDGDELAHLLAETLPRRFGVKDRLAGSVGAVLEAYLGFLVTTGAVVAEYELRSALAQHVSTFESAVAQGVAHVEGVAVTERPDTVVHRADRVGRDDPCPCGSGKKFKKCCMKIGR